MRERSLYFSFILVLLFCSSCEDITTYGGKNMIGCHKVISDSHLTGDFLNKIGTENIYLKLFSNKTFEIYTDINCCINNLKGKWKIEKDLESEYFMFKIGNGNYSNVPGLIFNGLNCNGHSGVLIFDLEILPSSPSCIAPDDHDEGE
ncbi:hypothetical protein ERX46_04095 [Brumimicrobium glaciale]|uniref:Uncharacterized protein n=1 Tax=Brumimicrobium glaciale TaxID=200475 RepID=A0A4Q4KMD6_9FLAO|nr:hypothetical protein [Brumimicrobium glaciale]RYM34563.1 hypothetical protein ERX46_04095 [Brumimicrobium glaciale]